MTLLYGGLSWLTGTRLGQSQACQAAIAYASLNPEPLLSYLGNHENSLSYFGEQSLDYTPTSLCPVK